MNIRIVKCKTILNEDPFKIIGFNVENDNNTRQIYHETVLSSSEISEKTDEECIDLAFNRLSSSISISAQKLDGELDSAVGNYYIP